MAQQQDPVGAGDDRRELRRRTERWFVRRGVPHLIDNYSAGEDIFTRALPVLALLVLVELTEPMRNEASLWSNALVLSVGAAVVVGALAVTNRVRGRPWYRRPDRVGPWELVLFVALGPAVQVLFGEATNAGVTLAANLGVLGVVYVVTSYGLLPMTRWAVGQLGRQLADVANLMVRSLPLLLVFTVFMFLNNEMWQVAHDVSRLWFGVAMGLLVATGSLFMVIRLARETEGMRRFVSWEEVAPLVAGTPVAPLAVTLAAHAGRAPGVATDGPDATPPLSRRARANLGLNLFVSQAIQIAFVAFAIGAFYLVFGLLVVSPATVATWTGVEQLDPLVTWELWGHPLVVTEALLVVCAFVSAIAGLQFTVSALTDASYREEFSGELLAALRRDLAVRAVYLRCLAPAHL